MSSGDYFSFTVTPDANFEFDLTSLTFDTIHNATNVPSEAPAENTSATMSFFVRSSVDGFTSDIGSIFTQTWNTTTPRSIDLSAAMFQNLTVPTEFRFYIFDSGVNTLQGARMDNVVLNGSVAVIPEPSTLTLAFVCLVGLGAWFRWCRPKMGA